MNTVEKLQQHLNSPVKVVCGYDYKEITPRITCKDGTTLSVQASFGHYCKPRANVGPYTHVEVWCVSAPVIEFDYDDDGPSAYIPIEDVAQLIRNHGGFKE